MSTNHNGGNAVPEITREEHDGEQNAKRVSLVSAATIYVISTGSSVNTGNVTLNPSPNFIGIVTVANPGSAELTGNVTLNSSPNFIGIVTVANPSSAALSGNVTLDAGSKTQIVGNLTLSDSKGFIGLVTIGHSVVVTQNSTLRQVNGNVTLSDAKTYIGLTTSTIGNTPTVFLGTPTLFAVVNTSAPGVQNSMVTLNSGPNQIGSVTVANPVNLNSVVTIVDGGGSITVDGTVAATQSGTWTVQPGNTANTTPWLVSPRGNITLSSSVNSIGFATVHMGTPTLFAVVNTSASYGYQTIFQGGTWTVTQASAARTITGNVTLSDSKMFIGLVTAVPSTTARSITGNVTLSDAKTYVGLVTATVGNTVAVSSTNLDVRDLTSASDSVAAVQSGTWNVGLSAGVNNVGFATVAVSTPTLFAVVNTAAAGVQNSMVTINAGPNQIGSVTVSNTVPVTGTFWQATQPVSGNVGILGNVTINSSVNSIGFATVAVSNTARSITGNVTLSDAKTYIGLTTATIGNTPAVTQSGTWNVGLSAGANFVGIVTVANPGSGTGYQTVYQGGTWGVGLNAGTNSIGFATVHVGTPTLYAIVNTSAATDPHIYIGLVTANISNSVGNATLNPSPNFIGIVTVANPSSFTGNITLDAGSRVGVLGNITLSDAKTYVGLVTATVGNTITVTQSSAARTITGNLTVLNAGTTKTLIPKSIAFALTSVSTIAVPTNTFKITNILLSANATTGVSIKSGATYLVGNASIRISLNPNGGLVESGSPDSPVYVGLAGAAAIVVEKNDATTAVAGKVIYFDE